MRALLIVNPHATSTNERRRDLLAHALAGEMTLQVAHTESRGHAAHLAAAAADSGVDVVVVHGGDGTVNEVVERPDVPRGPAGHADARGGARRFDQRLRQGAGYRPRPDRGHRADPGGPGHDRPRRCPSAGRAIATSPSTPGSAWTPRPCTPSSDVGAPGSAISNAAACPDDGRAVLPLRSPPSPAAPWNCRAGSRSPACTWSSCPMSTRGPTSATDPIRTNPGTSHLDRPGGVCADQHGCADRAAGRRRDPERPCRYSKKIIRAHDEPWATVRCTEPVGMQADGDYLGEKTEMQVHLCPECPPLSSLSAGAGSSDVSGSLPPTSGLNRDDQASWWPGTRTDHHDVMSVTPA